jgi:hypothetical protein
MRNLVISLLAIITLLSMIMAALPLDQPGPAAVGAELLALSELESLGQSFVATGDQIVGVQLGLKADPAAASLPLGVRLRYADGPPIDLVSTSVPLRANEQGVLELRFPPVRTRSAPHELTATLQLELTPPPLPPDVDARIVVSRGNYADGTASINGVAEPALDLAFTPIYRQSRLDQLWPVSAMADGRSGLPGWPPLYPLLAGSFLIGLVVALSRLQQVYREEDLGTPDAPSKPPTGT